MKKIISIITIGFLLSATACTKRRSTIASSENPVTEIQSKAKIEFSTSIVISSTDVIMFPLNLNGEKYESYERGGGLSYWNIVFHNVTTGKNELLTRNKLIISNIQIGNQKKVYNQPLLLSDQFIYYEVTNADFDGDKQLTLKDPRKLFISGLDGQSFIQISPEKHSISSWKIDEKHNLILMNALRDTNNNEEFDGKDEVEYFTYNLKTATIDPVFDEAFKQKLSELAKKVL